MADNISITAGAGTTVATDDVSGVHFQRVKLVDGTLDSSVAIAGDATNGLDVDVTRTVGSDGNSITVTLTVTNGAYSIGDVVGGLITFAAAVRGNGGKAVVNSVKLAGVTAIPYELWFFSADIATPRADNAVFGLAAADGAIYLGTVPIGSADYYAAQTAFNNACVRTAGLQVKAGAATTSIYAYLKATATTSPGTTTLYLTVDFEWIS
jgi:hypothetical protein